MRGRVTRGLEELTAGEHVSVLVEDVHEGRLCSALANEERDAVAAIIGDLRSIGEGQPDLADDGRASMQLTAGVQAIPSPLPAEVKPRLAGRR